jgi:hypothetical protein
MHNLNKDRGEENISSRQPIDNALKPTPSVDDAERAKI